jgi:hypothetical protein
VRVKVALYYCSQNISASAPAYMHVYAYKLMLDHDKVMYPPIYVRAFARKGTPINKTYIRA